MLPWFIHSFMLPQSVLIDRALSKAKIAENGEFSSTQKQFLSDTVDSIRVVAEWSAKTCNISPYVTNDYNYKMVPLIGTTLKVSEKSAEVATLLHKTLGHSSLLVLFHQERFMLSAASKRRSKNNPHSNTIEFEYSSPWMSKTLIDDSLTMGRQDLSHLKAFYESYCRWIAEQESLQKLGTVLPAHLSLTMIRDLQESYSKLNRELQNVVSKARKEKQVSAQVQLNNQARQIKAELESLKKQMNPEWDLIKEHVHD